MEHWWNGTDRGECGMVLTGESMEHWWNGTDRRECGMVLTGESVEWY